MPRIAWVVPGRHLPYLDPYMKANGDYLKKRENDGRAEGREPVMNDQDHDGPRQVHIDRPIQYERPRSLPPDVPHFVVMHDWLEAHEARERKERSFDRAESSNEQTPEPRNTRESLTNLARVIKEENPIHAQQLENDTSIERFVGVRFPTL